MRVCVPFVTVQVAEGGAGPTTAAQQGHQQQKEGPGPRAGLVGLIKWATKTVGGQGGEPASPS